MTTLLSTNRALQYCHWLWSLFSHQSCNYFPHPSRFLASLIQKITIPLHIFIRIISLPYAPIIYVSRIQSWSNPHSRFSAKKFPLATPNSIVVPNWIHQSPEAPTGTHDSTRVHLEPGYPSPRLLPSPRPSARLHTRHANFLFITLFLFSSRT